MRRRATKPDPAPTRAATVVMARSSVRVWLMAGLLALLTLGVYWPVMRHDFVAYDDDMYVTANVHVQGGLTFENIKWACFNTAGGNWHPLTMWSHMADCQLFGLKPWGHHLTSVMLHALNTVLVFLLLRSLTGAFWRSAVVAALFGLHPLHVESVAWVAERKDVLSTGFGLLSLVFYARYGGNRLAAKDGDAQARRAPLSRPLNYLLALAFFGLGLMSKPMLVTWPFVLLLLDYWPLERFKPGDTRRLLVEKVPFFALAAIVSVGTFMVQARGDSVLAAEAVPFGARSANALISYARYLAKLFWPTDLAVFYPYPGSWPLEQVLLAGGLLAGLSVVFFLQRRRYPCLLMGWLWFCGTLVPVIGLVQAGLQSMADRYTYIPSLGVLIVAVWGVGELAKGWHYRVAGLSAAGSIAALLCLVLTRRQLAHWQDTEALFRHAVEVTQNNFLAHLNLGVALDEKGQSDEAMREFQEAIRLKPDYVLARSDLGVALVRKGQIDAGISQYQEAIRLKPDYVPAHNNLGLALVAKGRIDEAIREFQDAIRREPGFAEAHCNLGMAFLRKGQIDAGITEFQAATRLKPGFAEAHSNLGMALVRKGQIDAGITEFQEAIRLKPDFSEARTNLALTLAFKNSGAGR